MLGSVPIRIQYRTFVGRLRQRYPSSTMTSVTPRKTRGTGRPTLEQVAQRAGVSTITASRALRGLSTVGPEYVERVREAARELNYVANAAARALARGIVERGW